MSPKTDPFGLLAFLHWNHSWNNHSFDEATLKKSLDQLHDLGISFIRMDILWSDIFSDAAGYNFERYDRIIDGLTKKNIRVLGLLHYNKDYMVDGKEAWNTPPTSNAEFAAYVGTTVARYKNTISHWEIWNEPNHPAYWAAPKDGLKRYSSLLKESYRAAKAANPSCTVLNGGLTMTIEEDVENLYREAGKESFDILNIHMFINPQKPDAGRIFEEHITAIEKIMSAHKDDKKKIWITEIGCPGVPAGQIPAKWFEGEAQDENEQAEWLNKVYELVRNKQRVEKLFWAFYRDTDKMFKDATDHFGIVRSDLSPKPAFFVLKNLIAHHARG